MTFFTIMIEYNSINQNFSLNPDLKENGLGIKNWNLLILFSKNLLDFVRIYRKFG